MWRRRPVFPNRTGQPAVSNGGGGRFFIPARPQLPQRPFAAR